MLSRNKWFVSGRIKDVRKYKNKTVTSIEGKAYRRDVFSYSVRIDCVINKQLWKSVEFMNLKSERKITMSGLLDFKDKNVVLVADHISVV